MRLSELAQQLLDQRRLNELRALPYEQLIHEHDQDNYQQLREHTAEYTQRTDTQTMGFQDPIFLESIESAAVLSSGFIYSEAAIQGWLAANFARQCPYSRQPLTRIDGLSYYLLLPQVDSAIANFRTLRRVHRAMQDLRVAEGEVRLELKVSGSKFRLMIRSDARAAEPPHQLLEHFLAASFDGNPASCLSSQACSGYHVQGFGRCWDINADSARVEFWFPCPSEIISDTDVNELITTVLTPLDLPAVELPEDACFGSIRELAAREYYNAFEAIPMSVYQAAQCCQQFLQKTAQFARDKGIELNYVITFSQNVTIEPARHAANSLFFGAPANTGRVNTTQSIHPVGHPANQTPLR